MSRRVAPSLGCGYLVVIIITGAGCACLRSANHRYHAEGGVLSSSVLIPLVIGILFLAGALTYAIFAHRMVRQYGEDEHFRSTHPDKPWLWKREWRGEAIESDDRSTLAVKWTLAVVWNALSLPGVAHFIQHPPRDKMAYLIFLFPLVGTGLLASATYQTLRRHKYGRVRFIPAALPGVIGGHLGGVIQVPARIEAAGDIRLALRCVNQVVRGSGKNRHSHENVLWEAVDQIRPENQSAGYRRSEIPVLFAIPRGQPATSLDDPASQVRWHLLATAETPGVDFSARFHLPVFPGTEPESVEAPQAVSDHQIPVASNAPGLTDEALKSAGVERLLDGWRFTSRPLRFFKWITLLIQAVTAALLILFAAHDVPLMASVFVAPFGLIAFLFSYDLLQPASELRRLGPDLIVTDYSWFRRRLRRVPLGEIDDLRAERSLEIGTDKYHRLILVGRPVGDPPSSPHPQEPFATRKLRHQLGRATPVNAPTIRARLAASPRFEITFASHVPGPAVLESVRAEVLARLGVIRDGKS